MRHRFTAGLLTLTIGAGLLALGTPEAQAGSKGRRNTAIGLGALAAYGLLSGKTGTGLAAGAGAAYAYKRYRDAKKDERRSSRYYSRYGSGYRTNSGNGYYYAPAGYNGNGGYQYQNGGQYEYRTSRSRRDPRERRYTRGDTRPYVTDTWGNRRYYDPRYGDGFKRYDGTRYRRAGYRSRYNVDREASQYSQNDYEYCPPGQSRGRKTGWRRR
jgi:hypothetical protein